MLMWLIVPEDIVIRDNRDVFDDKMAQLLTQAEINEARATMSAKVDRFSGLTDRRT